MVVENTNLTSRVSRWGESQHVPMLCFVGEKGIRSERKANPGEVVPSQNTTIMNARYTSRVTFYQLPSNHHNHLILHGIKMGAIHEY